MSCWGQLHPGIASAIQHHGIYGIPGEEAKLQSSDGQYSPQQSTSPCEAM